MRRRISTKHFHVLLCLLLMIVIGCTVLLVKNLQQEILIIGSTKINIILARTQDEKLKGLCCRDSLAVNDGMLFAYDKPGRYRFWMKDTRIALDMYWLNSAKEIIHIEHNVRPETYPQSFGPSAYSQYILETNAGFAKKHDIKVGDKVSFQGD